MTEYVGGLSLVGAGVGGPVVGATEDYSSIEAPSGNICPTTIGGVGEAVGAGVPLNSPSGMLRIGVGPC